MKMMKTIEPRSCTGAAASGAAANATEHVIDGGNHAQFGSYGLQAGDGIARISPQQQIDETVSVIVGTILGSDN
ncbi:MAG: hypothetical protein IJP98_03650 [Clostridia bacterium]|nr:hypothetical protein [Clostridia bacterium]